MWQETEQGLYRQFTFSDFAEAFRFMQQVAEVAERRQHHPRWQNEWNRVDIWLQTHSAGGNITKKDYQLAEAIDTLLGSSEAGADVNAKNLPEDKAATEEVKEIKLYADGGSRGNPGPSASGYVLYDMDGNILARQGVYLGVTTNNQAEYLSLKMGLQEARKLHASIVHVHMDSLLVVNQMTGKFKVKNRDLWPIYEAVKELLPSFEKVNFTHVPRELNKEADAAVNEAMDASIAVE